MSRSRLLLLTALAAGCQGPAQLDLTDATGALLSLDYLADSDVVGFHVEVERVACDASDTFEPKSWDLDLDLVDGLFPGGVTLVEERPFEPETRHTGADVFLELAPGCYAVTAEPASDLEGEGYTASDECATARVDKVRVVEDQLTQVLLLSQCEGDPDGGAGVTVHLNHPPVVLAEGVCVNQDACVRERVCVTVYDPDDDPVSVVWSQVSGPDVFRLAYDEPEVVGFEHGRRVWLACADVSTREPGEHVIEIAAFDHGWIGGQKVRLSDVIGTASMGVAELSVSTVRTDAPHCYLDGYLVDVPGLARDLEPHCDPVSDEAWYCSGAFPTDPDVSARVCSGGTLWPEELYPACMAAGGGD